MCFSATSSFAAAGMLSGIGLLSVLHVRKARDYALALVPFGFAMQQLAEGIIWQRYGYFSDQELVQAMAYVFLIIAFVVWPVWIPGALWMRERAASRKKILFYFLLWGLVVAAYAVYTLIFNVVGVRILNHSIAYMLSDQHVQGQMVYLISYVIATVVSFFISSKKLHWLFGILIASGLLAAYVVWSITFISVWCFFAALVSMLILVDMYSE